MSDATTVALISKALDTAQAIAKARPKTAPLGTTVIPSGTVAVVADQTVKP